MSNDADMETTKLSSKGQVVLPKSVREAHGWGPGTEVIVESTADGVQLRAKAPFRRTHLNEVFGRCHTRVLRSRWTKCTREFGPP